MPENGVKHRGAGARRTFTVRNSLIRGSEAIDAVRLDDGMDVCALRDNLQLSQSRDAHNVSDTGLDIGAHFDHIQLNVKLGWAHGSVLTSNKLRKVTKNGIDACRQSMAGAMRMNQKFIYKNQTNLQRTGHTEPLSRANGDAHPIRNE